MSSLGGINSNQAASASDDRPLFQPAIRIPSEYPMEIEYGTPRPTGALTSVLEDIDLSVETKGSSITPKQKRARKLTRTSILSAHLRGNISSFNNSNPNLAKSKENLFFTVELHQNDLFRMMSLSNGIPIIDTNPTSIDIKPLFSEEKREQIRNSNKSYIIPRPPIHSNSLEEVEAEFSAKKHLDRLTQESGFLNACLVLSPAFCNIDSRFGMTPIKVFDQTNRKKNALTMHPDQIPNLQEALIIHELGKQPTDNFYHSTLVALYTALKVHYDEAELMTIQQKEKKKNNLFKSITNTIFSTFFGKKTDKNKRKGSQLKESSEKHARKGSQIKELSEQNTYEANPIKEPDQNTPEASPREKPLGKKETKRLKELVDFSKHEFIFSDSDDVIELKEDTIKWFHNQKALIEDPLRIDMKLKIKYPIPTHFILLQEVVTIEKFHNALLSTYKSKEHVLTEFAENFSKSFIEQYSKTKKEIVEYLSGHYKGIIQELIRKALGDFTQLKEIEEGLIDLFSNKTRKLLESKLVTLKNEKDQRREHVLKNELLTTPYEKIPRRDSKNETNIKKELINIAYEIFKITAHYACARLFKHLIEISVDSTLKIFEECIENKFQNIVLLDESGRKNPIAFNTILFRYINIPMYTFIFRENCDFLKRLRKMQTHLHFGKKPITLKQIIDQDILDTLKNSNNEKLELGYLLKEFSKWIGEHQKALLNEASPRYYSLYKWTEGDQKALLNYSHNDLDANLHNLEDIHAKFLSLMSLPELNDLEKKIKLSQRFFSTMQIINFDNNTLEFKQSTKDPLAIKLKKNVDKTPILFDRIKELIKLHQGAWSLIPDNANHQMNYSLLENIFKTPNALWIHDGKTYVNAFERVLQCLDFFTSYQSTMEEILNKPSEWSLIAKKLLHNSEKNLENKEQEKLLKLLLNELDEHLKNRDHENFLKLLLSALDERFDQEIKILILCYKSIALKMLEIISIPGALNGKELNKQLYPIFKTKLNIIFRVVEHALWEDYYVLLATIEKYLRSCQQKTIPSRIVS